MPSVPVPADVDQFLRRANPAIVGTLRRDGSPHTVPTWYDWEDGRVLLNMDESRARLQHIRRDPRVSLTVLDGNQWYRHVSLLGRVVQIEDDDDWEDIDRLSRRYTGNPYSRWGAASARGWSPSAGTAGRATSPGPRNSGST